MPNALKKTPTKKSQPKVSTVAGSSKLPGGWRLRLRPSLVHSIGLAAACLVSYWVTTELLAKVYSMSKTNDMLGGLWAVISTAFVYRVSLRESRTAAFTRVSATLWSFALCLVYLLLAPFHPWGLALMIGVGAFVLALIGREDNIVVCSITTAVVLIVAGLSPHDAWQQPILRLSDTVVGTAVGLAAAWTVVHLSRPQTS